MNIQHCIHKFDHKAEYTEHDVEPFSKLNYRNTSVIFYCG